MTSNVPHAIPRKPVPGRKPVLASSRTPASRLPDNAVVRQQIPPAAPRTSSINDRRKGIVGREPLPALSETTTASTTTVSQKSSRFREHLSESVHLDPGIAGTDIAPSVPSRARVMTPTPAPPPAQAKKWSKARSVMNALKRNLHPRDKGVSTSKIPLPPRKHGRNLASKTEPEKAGSMEKENRVPIRSYWKDKPLPSPPNEVSEWAAASSSASDTLTASSGIRPQGFNVGFGPPPQASVAGSKIRWINRIRQHRCGHRLAASINTTETEELRQQLMLPDYCGSKENPVILYTDGKCPECWVDGKEVSTLFTSMRTLTSGLNLPLPPEYRNASSTIRYLYRINAYFCGHIYPASIWVTETSETRKMALHPGYPGSKANPEVLYTEGKCPGCRGDVPVGREGGAIESIKGLEDPGVPHMWGSIKYSIVPIPERKKRRIFYETRGENMILGEC
ncbi:MAG: hypothetical protein M1827_005437 [Pycnora praestabilis]|nr:MAG: hypothetical protein M1827_005437 [Pycnora praestabilis]